MVCLLYIFCVRCLLDAPLAGVSFHGRVCTPGRLRRRGAVLRETPPPPPAGDSLSCFAKKVGKEGDPASPVIRCANDSPALLEVGGRRGTRRLRRLRQLRRKAPPTSPLLGGSDGLFGITEPWLGLWSGLNGWRKADPLGAFDCNGRLPGANSPANPCQKKHHHQSSAARVHGRTSSPQHGHPPHASARAPRRPSLPGEHKGAHTP